MKYFSIKELTSSQTAQRLGIDNTPPDFIRRNLAMLVDSLLDPFREAWETHCILSSSGDARIRVTSGYRCKALNSAVGGVMNSAHMYGYAADLVPYNGCIDDFEKFCIKWLKENDISFDQCIEERTSRTRWLHLAVYSPEGRQRKMIFNIDR